MPFGYGFSRRMWRPEALANAVAGYLGVLVGRVAGGAVNRPNAGRRPGCCCTPWLIEDRAVSTAPSESARARWRCLQARPWMLPDNDPENRS